MFYLVQTVNNPSDFASRIHVAATIYNSDFEVVHGVEVDSTTRALRAQNNFDPIRTDEVYIFVSDVSDTLE